MQVAVVFALLVTLACGSPVPQRTAQADDEQVQPHHPVLDHLDQTAVHSAVEEDQGKKAANWWEKDAPATTAVEPEKVGEVVAAEALPTSVEPVESGLIPAVAIPLPAAIEAEPADAAATEEEVQKVSQTDVEATWNKPADRQGNQPEELKPWWETDSSSSAAPEVVREVAETTSAASAEEPAKVPEAAVVPDVADEEGAVAAPSHHAADGGDTKNFQPLKPHHSSVNKPVARQNDDEEDED